MKKISFFYIILIIFSSSYNQLYSQTENEQNFSKLKASFDLYTDFIRNVVLSYPVKIDPELLTYYAIQNAVFQLDPYTSVYNINDFNPNKEIFLEDFFGYGFSIDTIDSKIYIYDLIPLTSASKSGIMVGDQILKVNNIDISNNPKLFDEILDSANSDLPLEIFRECANTNINFVLNKTKTKNIPLNLYQIPNTTTFYLNFKNFYKNVSIDLSKKLKKLDSAQIQSLIIDLRSNPGGLVNEAIKIANIFQSDTLPVCKVVGQDNEVLEEYRMNQKAIFPNLKLIILTDSLTASASEILASILQESDRAVLIGTSTFGKGLVQTQIPLRNGFEMRMTSGKYLTSVGRWIQHFSFAKSFFKDNTDTNKVFHSKNGRLLYQKKGIQPDIYMLGDSLSQIEKDLVTSDMIFLYLNTLNCSLDTLKNTLNEKSINFDSFISFLEINDFYKKSSIYKNYLNFKDALEEYTVNENQNGTKLKEFVNQVIKSSLQKEKNSIRKLVYFYAIQRIGDIQFFFDKYYPYDKLILKSIDVLKNDYDKLLSGIN